MNIIEQALARVPVTEGFVGLHLVEVGTGHVLASIEPEESCEVRPFRRETLIAAMTEVVQRIMSMATLGGVPDDLEDLVITMTDHYHLIRVVPGFAGTDAYLLLSLDRARGNLALARYLLLTFEAELVA